MKHRGRTRKHRVCARILSWLLVLAMLVGMVPSSVMTARAAEVPEMLVTSLTEIYSGDETRAREDLEALNAAGLLGDDGKLVDLKIREDGESVELDALAKRITDGETVGNITVNGNTATAEQIVKISQVNAALEIAKLLDEEIDVTDEHVSNLESLLTGIQDGSVDLENALKIGTLSLESANSTLQGAGDSSSQDEMPIIGTMDGREETASAPAMLGATGDLPTLDGVSTAAGELKLTVSEDGGSYIAPYVSGSEYVADYKFALADPSQTDFSEDIKYAGSPVARMTTGFADEDIEDKHIVMPADSVSVSPEISFTLPGSASLEFPDKPWDFDYDIGYKYYSTLGEGDEYYRNDPFDSRKITVPAEGTSIKWTPTLTCSKPWLGERAFVYSLANYYYDDYKNNQLIDLRNVALNNGKNAQYGRLLVSKEGATEANTGDDATSTQIKSIRLLGQAAAYNVTPGLHYTYLPDEYVPIVVVFKNYVRADEDTELIVNGQKCKLLDGNNVYFDQILFGYKVDYTSNTTLVVESLSGLKTRAGGAMTLTNGVGDLPVYQKEFTFIDSPKKSGDLIETKVCTQWFDWDKAYCATDDNRSAPTVTAVIPFKSDDIVQQTIINLDYMRSGDGEMWGGEGIEVSLDLPGYRKDTKYRYFPFMYFSYNGPTVENGVYQEYCLMRYPAYLVFDESGNAAAIATRFAAPVNLTNTVRRDTLCLYVNDRSDAYNVPLCKTGVFTSYDRLLYSDSSKDSLGYPCANYANVEELRADLYDEEFFRSISAPAVPGGYLQFFVPPSIKFSASSYRTRTEGYTEVEGGFIKLTEPEDPDFAYVYLKDAKHPERRYDMEIAVTEDLYNACVEGTISTAGKEDYRTAVHFDNSLPYGYREDDAFGWKTADEQSKLGFSNDLGKTTTLLPLEASENVIIQLYNYPEGKDSEPTLMAALPTLTIEESGGYLTIPKTSQVRETLIGLDTDIMFASNAGSFNQMTDSIEYNASLYKIEKSQIGQPIPTDAEPMNTADWGRFRIDNNEMVSHITVRGGLLTEEGTYAVEISTKVPGETEYQTLSATAYLIVKHPPVQVKFDSQKNAFSMEDGELKLSYTLTSAAASPEVKYTVQGSGDEGVTEMPASGGTVSFTPKQFEGLKKLYTVTIYARNYPDEPWSMDSKLLSVYNAGVLRLLMKDVGLGEIGGTTGGIVGDGTEAVSGTIHIDNSDKIKERLAASGEGEGVVVNYDDFYTLRTEMGLLRSISANYGEASWGAFSDKLQWSATEKSGEDSNDVTLNYEQGGLYSDLRSYNYTYYIPSADLLVMATDDKSADVPVTITATHAASGMKASVDVTVNTLEDELYLFRFSPKTKTKVIYTNGDGVRRELHSDMQGQLAVYEPKGIRGDVVAMSEIDGETYVGTIAHDNLVGGEQDVTRLNLYPSNDLTLVSMSSYTVTFLQPDGKPYNGPVTLRAGVYKGGVYCPDIGIHTSKGSGEYIVRDDAKFTAKDGKITVWYDPTLLVDEGGNWLKGLQYVYEYRTNDSYVPAYAILNPASGNPADSVIYLQEKRVNANVPQITRQEYQQYLNGTSPTSYMRNVIDSKENIGISRDFSMSKLYTDIVLLGEEVGRDGNGYTTYQGENIAKFAFYTTDDVKLSGQSQLDGENLAAQQIINLSDLDSAELFVFPFSAIPMLRSTYTMTDKDMKANGITDEGANPTPTARIKAVITRGGMTVRSITMPFGITNVSHQPNLNSNQGATAVGKEVSENLKETMDMGKIFKSINVNDMIKKGFVFLGNLAGAGGDGMINLMILPTQDPATFRIIAFVGANQRGGGDEDGVSVNFNSQDLAEDMNKFKKEMDELSKKKDDENDSGGEGSMEFNFYGTIILEARAGVADGKWDIAFRGGNVGTNVKGKYEWGQTFMCGPYPAFISFEVGFHADLEVAFGNKGAARAMLLDAALGVSIEAFAGLGFDLSIVAIQLGIYGQIGADVNYLLLTPSNASASTGTKLDIAGEIGIKLKVKLLFISYSKKFASTGFNWTKRWGSYDNIKKYWSDQGYATLTGVTSSGRAYAMYLFEDGSAMVEIDGGAELENRDYLELEERAWTGGAAAAAGGRRLLKSAGAMTNVLTNVETNSYPYSHPAFTDDGQMFLYISDNNNAKKVESVTSYAVKNSGGYGNKERVDTSEDNVLADLDVVASGADDKYFAAWVKQVETPKRANKDAAVTNDELGMMFNATEIYAGSYNGTAWTTTRLTDNNVADMAPTVASYGNQAIVAWRSMNASSMAAEGTDVQDITAMFDVENNINYRIYDGTDWKDVQVAYNGTAGTVNAIDSAMLSDGTAILVYTVRTGEDVTTTETFYTLISDNGSILTTGRLTNDSYTDTNAQVTAVNEDGGYFVLGWYSEHDAGEGSTAAEYDANGNVTKTKAVVAHDIRLARINANGSYDIDFPESIGGTGETGISSAFHFSAPAKNTDLEKVSIVWSQRKDSDEADDAGKYELNAVRFFKADSVTGLTAPTDIAETSKNYTIDHFDTYTDGDGAVHAIILGSDYSSLDGISVYDSIDLSKVTQQMNGENSAEENQEHLNILDGEAISSLKLATGSFPTTAANVTADMNIDEVIPGFTMPVQFTVTNKGTGTLDTVTAEVGEQSKEFTGLNLLPNQSATLLMSYNIPESRPVADAAYTVTSGGMNLGSGTLTLNRPDVGISGMKILQEYEGKRDIQVMLGNNSEIPLAASGKTVKLAFYKDPFHESRIGDEISIPADDYAEIDEGTYTTVRTLNVTDISDLNSEGEIPEEGLTVYARAWVEEPKDDEDDDPVISEEPNIYNNDNYVSFKGLLTRNNGEKLTIDTTLASTDGQDKSYTVYADIRNNSMQEANVGTPVAVLLDSENNIIAKKNLQEESLTLGAEGQKSLDVEFTAGEIDESRTPVMAVVCFTYKVTFALNGGSAATDIDPVQTELDGRITLPQEQPQKAAAEGEDLWFFAGWYTEETDGDVITEDYIFEEDITVYAHYVHHQHDFTYIIGTGDGKDTIIATCANTDKFCYLDDEGRHTATLKITAPEGDTVSDKIVYDQAEHPAIITDNDGIQGSTKVLYAKKGEDGEYGDAVETAPKNAGTYRASITLGEGDKAVTAAVEYTIEKADPTAAAPAGLTATYGQTLEDVELNNPAGNTPGTWTWVDDTDTSVGNAGDRTFKADFTPTDMANYNVKNGVNVTVTVNQAANPAEVADTVSVRKGGKTVDLAKCVTLNGAKGTVTYEISGQDNGCTLNGSILTTGSDMGTVKVNVTVAEDENYLALETQAITVTIAEKDTQTVTAKDVTATYGDTDKRIKATTDGEDAGITISYAVKEGSENYIEIAPDGKLTIKKVPADGKAYVTVTASETTDYFGATKEVTVTINKADAVAATVTGNSGTYDGTNRPLVTVDDSAQVGGTMWYAVSTDADKEPAEDAAGTPEKQKNWKTAIPAVTDAGTYYVWYKFIVDENHNEPNDTVGSTPVEVIVAPAAITITPADKSSKYLSALQKLTYQVGGAYHEGDELNIVLETTATASSVVGTYPITVKSWENANYTATLGTGTYTITRTDLTVTAVGYDGTYDGEDHSITVDVGDSGATVYYSTEKELTKENYKQDGSTTNPVRKEAGSTTVYYYVETINYDPQPVSGSKDIVIAKATNAAVPEKLTATKASSGASDAVLNGVNDMMEYSADGGQTWTKVPEGAISVTGLAAGDVLVRYAESTNYNAGTAVTITVIAKDDQAAPDSTAFVVTRPSKSIAKDGSISGVNDTMEYSLDGGQTWTKVTAGSTVITGIGTGNVLIRVAGTADYNPSPAVSVKVGFGSGEMVVYFAPDSDSEYDQIVTYNEELKRYEYVYTGSGIKPAIIVEGLDGSLTEGVDYTVSYSNNLNVDKKGRAAQVTVTGKGNYTKKKTLDFYILPKALDDGNGNAADDINVAKVVVAQGGKAAPVISYNGNVLKKTDYTVTSSTGSLKFKTAVEDATLTITAKEGGNFTGAITDIPVTVLTKAEAKQAMIKVTLAKGVKRTYTGKPHTLNITGNDGSIDGEDAGGFAGELTVTDVSGKVLTEGTDFVVSYSANVNVGTVKVTVTGIGDYTGTVTKTFKIKADTKDAVIKTYFADGMISTDDTANAPKFTYRKGGVKPVIVVTAERGDEVITLSEGTDYKISYSGNNKVGTKAKFTINFLGNYKGRAAIKNQTFEIVKASLADADITIGDKAYTVYIDDDGKKYANKSVPYVSVDGAQLKQNTDYTVTYWYNGQKIKANKIKLAANEESREITVKITGKGNYEAETFETTYTVKKVLAQSGVLDLTKAKIYAKDTKKAVPAQGYIGEPIEPEIDVYVKIGKTWTKVDESLYTVTYVNNVERGKAKILVNGDGEGAVGSKKGTFKITKWKFSMLSLVVD